MTMLTFESFDWYEYSALPPNTYDPHWYVNGGSVSMYATGGRRGTHGFQAYTDDGLRYLQYEFVTQGPQTSLVIGFAMDLKTASGANWFKVLDSDGAVQFVLYLTAARKVQVLDAWDGSVICEGNDDDLTLGIYQYVEFKFNISHTGNFVFRVNGVEKINVSGVDLQHGTSDDVAKIRWHSTSNYTGYIGDDLYILNQEGSTFNDFLGDVKVDTFKPTTDGYHDTYYTSTTSFWDALNDIGNNTHNYYVEADTTGEKFSVLYTFTGDLPTVYGVRTQELSFNPDIGVAVVTPFIRISGIDYDLDDYERGDTQEYSFNYVTARPDTGGAWSKTLLNQTEFGFHFSNAY